MDKKVQGGASDAPPSPCRVNKWFDSNHCIILPSSILSILPFCFQISWRVESTLSLFEPPTSTAIPSEILSPKLESHLGCSQTWFATQVRIDAVDKPRFFMTKFKEMCMIKP